MTSKKNYLLVTIKKIFTLKKKKFFFCYVTNNNDYDAMCKLNKHIEFLFKVYGRVQIDVPYLESPCDNVRPIIIIYVNFAIRAKQKMSGMLCVHS